MHLINLLNELLTKILENDNENQNCLDIHDYLDLSITNKKLHLLIFPLVYRSLRIKLNAYGDDQLNKIEVFARDRFFRDPELKFNVRELNIECAHRQVKYGLSMSLKILQVTPNVEILHLGYDLESETFIDQIANLLCSGCCANLRTLRLSCSICTCKMKRFFTIRGMRSLSLGYFSPYNEQDCKYDHSELKNPNLKFIGSSTVSHLSFSS